MFTFFGVTGLFPILVVLFIGVIIPIFALIEILRSRFAGTTDKLIWVIIVIAFNAPGALLYFVIGRKQRIL